MVGLSLVVAACGADPGIVGTPLSKEDATSSTTSAREAPTTAGAPALTTVAVAGGSGRPCASPADVATASARIALDASEYQFSPLAPVKAGKVAFDGRNTGQVNHEIAVVKATGYGSLPKNEFGTVEESKLPPGLLLGRTTRFAPGQTCAAVYDLTPGSYVLLCNIEFRGATVSSHAGKGMTYDFIVSA